MTSLLLVLFSAAPPKALPDLPAPLGMLDRVLEAGETGEKVVEVSLPGCDHPRPVNVSRFVAGTAYAMQQMVEWLYQAPDLKPFPAGALDEVTAGITHGSLSDQKACHPLPKELTQAPRLCPGPAADQAWLVASGKPVVSVRWSSAGAKDKCLPKLTGVLFDGKGVARIRYEADFGGAAAGALLGDKCQVVFTFEAKNEVFHAARRGCKER